MKLGCCLSRRMKKTGCEFVIFLKQFAEAFVAGCKLYINFELGPNAKFPGTHGHLQTVANKRPEAYEVDMGAYTCKQEGKPDVYSLTCAC